MEKRRKKRGDNDPGGKRKGRAESRDLSFRGNKFRTKKRQKNKVDEPWGKAKGSRGEMKNSGSGREHSGKRSSVRAAEGERAGLPYAEERGGGSAAASKGGPKENSKRCFLKKGKKTSRTCCCRASERCIKTKERASRGRGG